MTPLEYALKYREAGISVLPIRVDESKAPSLTEWKHLQDRLATTDELRGWFSVALGLAAIGGTVSGHLKIFDVDEASKFEPWCDLVKEHLGAAFFGRLLIVRTPRPGFHIYVRCSVPHGNKKLAMALRGKEIKALVEIKAEGGYVLLPGSPIGCHENHAEYERIQGLFTAIPEITQEEFETLLSISRSFNEYVRSEEPVSHATASNARGDRPGDDFNARGDALGILTSHGWTVAYRRGDTAYLRRPGKTGIGISATFGHVAPNTLYVFSSSAFPFEMERAYDAFGVLTRLEHDGDIKAATKALGAQGYGKQKPKIIPAVTNIETLLDIPSESELLDRTTPTQDNIAMVFEHKFKDVLRFCNSWGKWFHWDESRWKEEKTLLAFHFARLLARKYNPQMKSETAKASFARGVEFLARASRTFATLPEQWDSNSKLLNTPHATQDLDTSMLRPHERSDHITKCTRIAPAEGPHPVFDMFLRDITLNDESLAEYHQRALGACLSGAIQDNFLLFWYGTGQNGKNTFGDLVEWILGDYAKVIPAETLMVDRHGPRHPTDLANLRGLRLAISSEVEEGSYFNEQRIKSLTGDAMIPARFMRQDFFEFPRTHKHLVYGNNRPLLRVVDPAMRARLHIVPFKAHFPPEARDPNMAEKLRAEAPQILQWLIDGHEKWSEDGYLKKCSAVQEETNAYFEEQSTPDMWIAECCLVDEMEACSAKELYASFKQWKEERGEGVMAMGRWSQWMGQRYQRKNWSGRAAYKGVTVLSKTRVGNTGNT